MFVIRESSVAEAEQRNITQLYPARRTGAPAEARGMFVIREGSVAVAE